MWVDRKGQEDPIPAPARTYVYARLSPDQNQIALDVRAQESDIWIWSIPRQTLTRVTQDARPDIAPIWTPDGKRIVFGATAGVTNALAWQAADGTGTAELLTTAGLNQQAPSDITGDGKRVVFSQNSVTGEANVLMLFLADRRVVPLLGGPYRARNGVVSPDGRWLAYSSTESGSEEIYVRPFPDVNAARVQVSTGGGSRPLWSRDGRELFYVAGFSPRLIRMMTAQVQQSGANFSASSPQIIFEGRYLAAQTATSGRSYDVSADGRRFLMIKEPSGEQSSVPTNFVAILNWTEELKRLVPAR